MNPRMEKHLNSEIRKTIMEAIRSGKGPEFFRFHEATETLREILPELAECVGVDGGQHHNETIFEHLVDSLEAAKDYPPLLQLAVLFHDIGKPATRKVDENGYVSFHKHEIVGASIAFNVCKRLGFEPEQTQYVTNLVRHHMFFFNEEASDKAVKKWLFKVGKSNWKDLILLRIADRKGNRACKGKPAVTKKIRTLEQKITQFIEKGDIIFREDVALTQSQIKELLKKCPRAPEKINDVYRNLIGILNKDKQRNTTQWITEHLLKAYGPKNGTNIPNS